MNAIKYVNLALSWLFLLMIIFFPWINNLTGKYLAICVILSLQSYALKGDDKKIRLINAIFIVALMIVISILGYGFKYFK